jgi:hypothetical protein
MLQGSRCTKPALGYHAQVVEEGGEKEAQAEGARWTLGLALPGVTVPWGHAAFLWVATAASLAFHEAGASCRSPILNLCCMPLRLQAFSAWCMQHQH